MRYILWLRIFRNSFLIVGAQFIEPEYGRHECRPYENIG